MNKLDQNTEQILINAAQDIIAETKAGTSPNKAIASTITRLNLPPLFIDRLVQAFNKSKSIHMLSTSNTKSDAFDLANAGVIKDILYKKSEDTSEEKEASVVVIKDLIPLTLQEPLQKVASAYTKKVTTLSKESIGNLLHKVASLKQGVFNNLSTDLRNTKTRMQNIVSEIAYESEYLDKEELQKTAQIISNAYPKTGKQLLRFVNTRLRENHKLPILEKSANASVLPNKPLFRLVTDAHDIALQAVKASNNLEAFEKFAADSFMQDFTANVLGQAVGNIGGPSQATADIMGTTIRKASYDAISPETFNTIQELESRKTFMDLVLKDKHFKDYDFKDLANAYLESVAMVPEAVDRPSLLRSLMLQHLDTGGVKDIFALGAESQIASELSKTTKARKEETKIDAELQALKDMKRNTKQSTIITDRFESPFANLLKSTTAKKEIKDKPLYVASLDEQSKMLSDLNKSKSYSKNLSKLLSVAGRNKLKDTLKKDLSAHLTKAYSDPKHKQHGNATINASAMSNAIIKNLSDAELSQLGMDAYVEVGINKKTQPEFSQTAYTSLYTRDKNKNKVNKEYLKDLKDPILYKAISGIMNN